MDIEKFVSADGRAEQVKEVRALIDKLGIEYLYLQFVSVTGRIVGKGIPADHWESVADKGFQLVYGATVNLFVNRRGQYLGYGPEAAELIGIPEPETFMQLPWDKRVARLWCTLFRNREEKEEPGAFLTSDCRGNLRRIHDQFKADHGGLHMRHGTEPEMMWLEEGRERRAGGRLLQSLLLSHRPVREPAPGLHARHRILPRHGPRHDPGRSRGRARPARTQLHLRRRTAHRRPAVDLPADLRAGGARVQPHRLLHVEAVHGRLGVGCHHNISFWSGGENVMKPLGQDANALPGMAGNFMYLKGGDNTFMPDTADVRMPGKIGLNVVAGIVDHLYAMTAIGCSTVNSYRRLWDTGFWAPVFADWGFQNRTTGLRISAPGRFEYRAVEFDGEPLPDGGCDHQSRRRRHQAQPRSWPARGTQHLRRHGAG